MKKNHSDPTERSASAFSAEPSVVSVYNPFSNEKKKDVTENEAGSKKKRGNAKVSADVSDDDDGEGKDEVVQHRMTTRSRAASETPDKKSAPAKKKPDSPTTEAEKPARGKTTPTKQT
eukprot:PhM_4_TR7867/c0_g1_i1/m.66150